MSEERALTWSKKWHIVNPDHPDAGRYAVSLCGTYVYRNDDPKYPLDLTAIREGKRKSAGLCKLCARSAKVATVTVELPEPPWKWAMGEGDAEDIYTRDGLVIVSGIDAVSPAYARELAALLLAAAVEAERSS